MAKDNDAQKESVSRDVSALKEAGYDTSDVGKGNSGFNAKEVGDLTDSSSREASEAGHQARADMKASGDLPEKK